jgi:hypothetical protein
VNLEVGRRLELILTHPGSFLTVCKDVVQRPKNNAIPHENSFRSGDLFDDRILWVGSTCRSELSCAFGVDQPARSNLGERLCASDLLCSRSLVYSRQEVRAKPLARHFAHDPYLRDRCSGSCEAAGSFAVIPGPPLDLVEVAPS